MLGRVCFAIKLDPKPADVAVLRRQQQTDRAAGNENGETFDSVTRGRAVGCG
jgi:hypothetical protein